MEKPILCGFELDTPIMNASGPRCTTYLELKDIEDSESCVIVTKSCTLLPREGNKGTRYYDNDYLSINSTGLANPGYEYYSMIAPHFTKKPLIISVAALCLQDNIKIVSALKNNIIELNLSCPNICEKGMIGYNFQDMDDTLRKIYEATDIKNMGLKMPPYFDVMQFIECAEIIQQYPIKFITCINSLGNGYVLTDDFLPSIEANQGFGGIGGSVILPFALSNVRKFRELLPSRISIIGCGGIKTGKDVYSHLLCGASCVQIGTEFQKEGSDVFKRLNGELQKLLNQ